MAVGDIGSAAEAKSAGRDRWIAVYIGSLAVLLAICAVGGGNAAKEATGKNIEAANTWAFFQAKNVRRHTLRLQIDELEILLATQPGLDDRARAALGEKIAQYRKLDAQLTSDPVSGEGLDELFHKGKALETRRDQALERDPYFDYGQALLQIAIVLASVAIVSGGNMLLTASGFLGLLGSLLTLNGFMLLWKLPFIG
ncbi:MAG: DUF4337 family protein [Hyphomicrobiaceae bacterium]|nr:DUF4337 family protein [Hyphomicrobiaceae bacterium]